jgi:hypothetical protein
MKKQNGSSSITDIEIWESNLITEEEITSENYPLLYNLSSALMYQFLPRPLTSKPPEYVHIPMSNLDNVDSSDLFISNWNLAWESAQIRYKIFEQDIPKSLRWLENFKDKNIYLIPGGENKYYAYLPIYHLLPYKLLKKFDLPLLRKGNWPHILRYNHFTEYLPSNFNDRVSNAFASNVWPLLNSRSLPIEDQSQKNYSRRQEKIYRKIL